MAANLQSMYHYWKSFDLQTLQKELDTTASDLAARQDDSDVARKRLVEQSRDFKKNAQEDVRKQVAPLLKSFQAEIDSLSKRSKNAEGAFLSVYKRLIDAPDPGAVLEHALQLQKRAQKVQDLEIENKQLRETLEEYNQEFAEVKNQEVTIKNLRDKLREYEERMEATAQARAKEKEKELQRVFADKERGLQETQLSVAKKLGEAEHKVATLQSALDTTQSELFDLKTKYDEATSAKSDEMEMIMADLERANERAASAEREAEQLNQHLASAKQNLQQAEQMQKAPDMEQAIDILKRSSLEVELAAKEKEIAELVEDVQRLQATVNKLRDSSASQVGRLEEELHQRSQQCHDLEQRLRTQEDYDEIKRELSLLKSIEFGSSTGSTESGPGSEDTTGSTTPSPGAKAKTLETLLLEKNRSLQTANTQLKVANNDITGPQAPPPPPPAPKQDLAPPPQPSPSLDPAKTPSSTPSTVGSAPPPPNSSLSNTELFASMLGQELVASYHLNQFRLGALGFEGMAAAAQMGLPNGFIPGFMHPMPHPPHPPPPISSSPSTPSVGNNHTGSESPLERIHSIAKSEITNCQILDTADVAQRIREVLSTNNIGQRLFAKHVLGLSQGTVSELLSKPKHWDKLTEKGRESYRKMALWAHDENNVIALKAIAPKKGNQPVNSSTKQEDTQTEERIAQILSNAQVAMQLKHSHDKNHEANAMVASIYQQELAKIEDRKDGIRLKTESKEGLLNGSFDGSWSESGNGGTRGRKPQTDSSNLTQEMVARIYQAELMKLAQAAEQSGNVAECHMYRQELTRLATNPSAVPKKPDSLRPPSQSGHIAFKPWETREDDKENHRHHQGDNKENTTALKLTIKKEPKEEPDNNKENITNPPSPSPHNMPQDLSAGGPNANLDGLRHAGSAFCLVRPRSNSQNGMDLPLMTSNPSSSSSPSPSATANSGDMSPLQRMQSIANSLMAKNNSLIQNQRPLKAVLPPITQEQFDSFTNINTDDLVKRVKEGLSQFSISQRLFGESVLGLSQGSVSDLLARPKPWHMLTQKGREPFIRMQIFLEDAEAIPKLVASQYRIAPEKFLRTEASYEVLPPKAKRRRTSTEDRDTPQPSKKARVYFTEEQKESLRVSYNKDPYPNQARIEQLADNLNVGTKTIVNWFHNHRMRNKHTNSPSMVSPPASSHSTKSEPEDLSNHSDQSQPGGMPVAQWMFPTFEPVLPNHFGGLEKAQDLSMSRFNDQSQRLNSSCSSFKSEASSSISPGSRKSMGGCTPPLVAQLPEPAVKESKPQVSVNKRKSSRPKWVYEGTQLDKSLHDADAAPEFMPQDLSCPSSDAGSPALRPAEPKLIEQEVLDNNNDKTKSSVNSPPPRSPSCSEHRVPSDQEDSDDKLPSSTSAMDWASHEHKIDKLQKNLKDEKSEDWEF